MMCVVALLVLILAGNEGKIVATSIDTGNRRMAVFVAEEGVGVLYLFLCAAAHPRPVRCCADEVACRVGGERGIWSRVRCYCGHVDDWDHLSRDMIGTCQSRLGGSCVVVGSVAGLGLRWGRRLDRRRACWPLCCCVGDRDDGLV